MASRYRSSGGERRWSSASSSSRSSRISLEPTTAFCGSPTTSWNSVRWNKPSAAYRSKVARQNLFGPQIPYTPTPKPSRTSYSSSASRAYDSTRKISDSVLSYSSNLRQGTASLGLFAPRSSSISTPQTASNRRKLSYTSEYESAGYSSSRRGSLSGVSDNEMPSYKDTGSRSRRSSITSRDYKPLASRSSAMDRKTPERFSFSSRTNYLLAKYDKNLPGKDANGYKPFDYRDSSRSSMTRIEPLLTSDYGRSKNFISNTYYQAATRSGPIYSYRPTPVGRFGYQKSSSDSIFMNGIEKRDSAADLSSSCKLSSTDGYDSSSSTTVEEENKKETQEEKRKKDRKSRNRSRRGRQLRKKTSDEQEVSSSQDESEGKSNSDARSRRRQRSQLRNKLELAPKVENQEVKEQIDEVKINEEAITTAEPPIVAEPEPPPKPEPKEDKSHSDSGTIKDSSDQESKAASSKAEEAPKDEPIQNDVVDKARVESLLHEIQEFIAESTQELEEQTVEIEKEEEDKSKNEEPEIEKLQKPVDESVELLEEQTEVVNLLQEIDEFISETDKLHEETPSETIYEDALENAENPEEHIEALITDMQESVNAIQECQEFSEIFEAAPEPEPEPEPIEIFTELSCQLEEARSDACIYLGKSVSKARKRIVIKKPVKNISVIASLKRRGEAESELTCRPIKVRSSGRLCVIHLSAKLSKQLGPRRESAAFVIGEKPAASAGAKFSVPVKEAEKMGQKAVEPTTTAAESSCPLPKDHGTAGQQPPPEAAAQPAEARHEEKIVDQEEVPMAPALAKRPVVIVAPPAQETKYVRSQPPRRRPKAPQKSEGIASVDREMLALLTLGEQLSASCTSLRSAPAQPTPQKRTFSTTKLPQHSGPPPIKPLLKPPAAPSLKPPKPATSFLSVDESIGTKIESVSPTGSFMTAASDFHGSLESVQQGKKRLNFFGQAFRTSFDNLSATSEDNPTRTAQPLPLLKASGSLPALQRFPSNTSVSSWYSASGNKNQSALDVASKKIDQVLNDAKAKHEEKSRKFRQAIAHLDQVYEDIQQESQQPRRPKVIRPKAMYGKSFQSTENLNRIIQTINPNPPAAPKPQTSAMVQSHYSESDKARFEPHLKPKFHPEQPPMQTAKLDFTRRWLEGDLNDWVHGEPKPDLLQSSGSGYIDADQHSLGSGSVEVAGFMDTDSRRERRAKKIPDLVPQKYQAVIKPSPIRYANMQEAQPPPRTTSHGYKARDSSRESDPQYDLDIFNVNPGYPRSLSPRSARQHVSRFLERKPETIRSPPEAPMYKRRSPVIPQPARFPADVMYQSAVSDEGYKSYYYKPLYQNQSQVSKFAQRFESQDDYNYIGSRFHSDEERRMLDSYYSYNQQLSNNTDPSQSQIYYPYSNSVKSVPAAWSARAAPRPVWKPQRHVEAPRELPRPQPAPLMQSEPQLPPDYETVDQMVAELELNIEDRESNEKPFPTTAVPRDGVDFVAFEERQPTVISPERPNYLSYETFSQPQSPPSIGSHSRDPSKPWSPFNVINDEKLAPSIVSSRKEVFERQHSAKTTPTVQSPPVLSPIRHKPVLLKSNFEPNPMETSATTNDYQEITPDILPQQSPPQVSPSARFPQVPDTPPPPRPPEHRFRQLDFSPPSDGPLDNYDNIPVIAPFAAQPPLPDHLPLSIEIPEEQYFKPQMTPKTERNPLKKMINRFKAQPAAPPSDDSSGGFKPTRSLLSLKTPSPQGKRKALTKALSVGQNSQASLQASPASSVGLKTTESPKPSPLLLESTEPKKTPRGGISSRLKQSLLGVRKKFTA